MNHLLEGSLTVSSSEKVLRHVLQEVVRIIPVDTRLLNVDTVARAFSNLNKS